MFILSFLRPALWLSSILSFQGSLRLEETASHSSSSSTDHFSPHLIIFAEHLTLPKHLFHQHQSLNKPTFADFFARHPDVSQTINLYFYNFIIIHCNMAILEDLGLEVKVLVNNSPLQEYEDNDTESTDDGFGDEIRKCRRYVEVVGDTEFGVQFRVTPNSNYLNSNRQRLRFEIDLDDHEELRGFLLRSKGEPVLIEGQVDYDGQTYAMRKFRFATMSTGTYPENFCSQN